MAARCGRDPPVHRRDRPQPVDHQNDRAERIDGAALPLRTDRHLTTVKASLRDATSHQLRGVLPVASDKVFEVVRDPDEQNAANAARPSGSISVPRGGVVIRTQTTILIDDSADDDRFVQYRPRALALGVRSCLAVPLDGGNRSVGALTAYCRRASAFGFRQRGQARRLAEGASRLLKLALVLAERIELTAQLRDAMTSRTTIDEATGIVMYQYQCTPEVAFQLPTDASRDRNIPLAVLALRVTTAASSTPPTEGFPDQSRPLT